jgi:hypothetical protein
MMGADIAVRQAVSIASIGIAISSAEHLALLGDFEPGGIFTPVLRSDSTLVAWNAGRRFLGLLESLHFFAAVLVVRLILAILILPIALATSPRGYTLLLWLIIVASLYVDWRRRVGGDGGEQMAMLVLLASAIDFTVAPVGSRGTTAALFIAAQSCLSYLSAGTAKLASTIWRSGNALVSILDTNTYGSARLVRVLRVHPRWSRFANWCIIVGEVSFPLVMVVPRTVCVAVLAIGLIFHLVTASVMGLNNFVWAFSATYPCIYWAATAWRHSP